jgi:hypothetical protein
MSADLRPEAVSLFNCIFGISTNNLIIFYKNGKRSYKKRFMHQAHSFGKKNKIKGLMVVTLQVHRSRLTVQ